MKLSKILLSGAVAMAMAIGMMGCAQVEDEHGILNVKGDTATIDYTNEAVEVYRGFRTLKTKHTDAVAVITIDPANATAKDGVFGFVFDLQKVKVTLDDGTKKDAYDFSSVAVRYNGGKLQTYISRFEGVDPDNMDGGDNFKDLKGAALRNSPKNVGDHPAYEQEILKGAKGGAYAELSGVTKNDDGTYSVAIEVVAVLDDDGKPTGDYSVSYYKAEDVSENPKEEAKENGTEKVKTGQIKPNSKPLSFAGDKSGTAVLVPASWDADDLKKPVQTDMGFYAAVYAGANLKGSIQLPYILNEDEVVEWED